MCKTRLLFWQVTFRRRLRPMLVFMQQIPVIGLGRQQCNPVGCKKRWQNIFNFVPLVSSQIVSCSVGARLGLFPDHKSFVQGVALDPLHEFVATLSCDRFLRIYSVKTKDTLHSITKFSLASATALHKNHKLPLLGERSVKMFHDDTMKSFFRRSPSFFDRKNYLYGNIFCFVFSCWYRLTFTPEGSLLIVPSGCLDRGQGESNEDLVNTTYIFTRNHLSKYSPHSPAT